MNWPAKDADLGTNTTSKPPTLLAILNADAWESQMVFLASHGCRCIAHDRRGHGRSSQPWNGNEMDAYADDLADLFIAMDLKGATLFDLPDEVDHLHADVKHMLLGHWDTTPGQNFIYVHLNRVIKKYDLDMIYVSGPGHGGPAVVGNTYFEGTYSEIYPNISQDETGLQKLFKQFSFPVGKHPELTPRLALFSEAEYDTKERWGIRAGTSYLLTKHLSLIGEWHSDVGWGGGLLWQF